MIAEHPQSAAPFQLQIPLPKMLTMREELELARKAVARQPDSVEWRFQLARQLVVLDHFDEVLGLLHEWNIDEYRFHDLMVSALISRETPADDLEAEKYTRRQLELATNNLQRSSALGMLAKIQIRMEQFDDARASLVEALALNKSEKDAYKRAAALELREHRERELLQTADRLADEGVLHSRLIASQSLALARLGMMEEARESQGLDRFLVQFEPAPPEGWNSLKEFNLSLAAEIAAHPDIRYERYGTASAQTWRVDEPSLRRSKYFPQLLELIRREVVRYVAELPEGDHPFLKGKLQAGELRNWCVITEGDGYETWHVHQNGWLSGVYYPQVQDHIANGTGMEGCIAFGVPEGIVGDENAEAFGQVICRPRSGLMMIFPSHTFHRTFPHKGDGRRICYAFDILPRDRQV